MAPADSGPSEDSIPGSWMAIFSLCPHMIEGPSRINVIITVQQIRSMYIRDFETMSDLQVVQFYNLA